MPVALKNTERRVWIPPVSKEQIAILYRSIKPVVRFGERLCYIRTVDLHEVSYIWEPRFKWFAFGLTPLHDITTYHGFGYHGFFKPSIAEVLAQIPQGSLKLGVIAFEIVDYPRNAGDLALEKEALNAGYHVAKTRLYIKK